MAMPANTHDGRVPAKQERQRREPAATVDSSKQATSNIIIQQYRISHHNNPSPVTRWQDPSAGSDSQFPVLRSNSNTNTEPN